MIRKQHIVCVRHGETVWKSQGRTQGQSDSPLTEDGVRQVQELARQLQGEHFDTLVSSPLGRAIQTARLLSDGLNIPEIQESARFSERNEGAFEGLSRTEQRATYPECFDSETGELLPDLIPGGETTLDFLARVSEGLLSLRALPSQRVLLVSHAGVMQAIVSLRDGRLLAEVASTQQFRFCDVLRFENESECESTQ